MKFLRRIVVLVLIVLFLSTNLCYGQGVAMQNVAKGVDFAAQGKFNEAKEKFERALKTSPFYAKKCLQIIDDVENKKITRKTGIHFFKGINYSIKGLWDDTIAEYSKAIEINPKYAKLYKNRGFAYAQGKGEYDKAISDYNKAIEIDQSDFGAYSLRGLAYAQGKGQYDKAIADFNKAIEINQGSAEVYNNRGFAYYNKGQFDRAIFDYTKAIEINPEFADAYDNRGAAHLDKGQFDQAITDYTKALEMNPTNSDAYNNRGIAYYKKRQYNEAISDYNKAIELSSDYADAYHNRAVAYYNKGEYRKAWEDVHKVQSLGLQVHSGFLKALHEAQEGQTMPADEMSSDEKGMAAFERGDYDTALRFWLPIAEQGDPRIQSNVASIYFGLGNGQEAVKWARKAAKQGYVNAQSLLGVAYLDGFGVSTDYREALYWLRKAADQGDTVAQYNLGFMYFKGYGTSKDFIQAYLYLELAAIGYQKDIDNGLEMKKKKKDAIQIRKKAARKLTRTQKKEAHRMVKEWRPKKW